MVGIGVRERDPRLQALFDAGAKVYSISKCNTIDDCLAEAYNSYVLHNRGQNGIYGILGTKIHDKLEDIMCNRAEESDLPGTLNEELTDLDMLGIEFPKDFKGNDTIRQNWVSDMKHFCNTFVRPKGNFTTEEFFLHELPDNRYLQGYIDLIRHNEDGSISIYDWKTSTDFKADDLIHHGRQLAIYKAAKEAEGFTVKTTAWVMLKYCEVSFVGRQRSNSKEETSITKVVNRGKIAKELEASFRTKLEAAGYDEIETDFIIKQALDNREIPSEIADQYTVRPYVRKYDATPEVVKEAEAYVSKQAALFESLDANDISQWPPRKFVKVSKAGKESDDTFRCNILCNFRKTCQHILKYNDLRMNKQTGDEDLF